MTDREHRAFAHSQGSKHLVTSGPDAGIAGKQTNQEDHLAGTAGWNGQPYTKPSLFRAGSVPWPNQPAASASAALPAKGTQRIAAPSEVQLGDLEVNERKRERVFVFNQNGTTATLAAQIEGSSALSILSKPDRLRPSREGFDPNAGIELSYSPTTSRVDDSVLVVSLSWNDGTSETVRIQIRAAAHKRSEPTHAQQVAEAADAKRDADSKKERDKLTAAHEEKVQQAQKRPGGLQPQIVIAFDKLLNAADEFFGNQATGVNNAADKVSLYARRKAATAVEPPIAIAIAKAALELATGRLSTLVMLAFDNLKQPAKFKQWEKGTTANISDGVLSGISSILGSILSHGKDAIATHLTWEQPANEGSEPSGETRVDFFGAQAKALHASVRERKDALVEFERALLPLNTPELAGMAAQVLLLLREAFLLNARRAVRDQEEEATRQWARFLSHASLGSIDAHQAKEAGLRPTRDRSPTADTRKALLSSTTHDGLIDVEFSADVNHPERPVTFTGARLFGLSQASVNVLGLDKKPLSSAGIPMRLRSSQSSSPLQVTVTCDEAGNVAFQDESGAAGMQTPWLSRRGGGRDDASAHRAAQMLIESVRTKTLGQLGVTLELNDGP